MTEFTRKELIARARRVSEINDRRIAATPDASGLEMDNALFGIALAALTAPTEPVYQYRIRNGYNGQVTEWQTIKRDQVDFVLKAQPLNAEFQIIAPPAPVVADFNKWFEDVILPAMKANGIKPAEQKMVYNSTQLAWGACRAAMQPKDGK